MKIMDGKDGDAIVHLDLNAGRCTVRRPITAEASVGQDALDVLAKIATAMIGLKEPLVVADARDDYDLRRVFLFVQGERALYRSERDAYEAKIARDTAARKAKLERELAAMQ